MLRPDWLTMDRKVPMRMFLRPIGTITVRPGGPSYRYFRWEPFWPISRKPCLSRTLQMSSEEGVLGNLQRYLRYLYPVNRVRLNGVAVLEVQLQSLLNVGDSFLFGVTVTGYLDFKTPRDKAVFLAINDHRKLPLRHRPRYS